MVGFGSFVGLVQAGGGQQADEMSAQDQSNFKFYEVLIGVMCVPAVCLVKISVGFFLLRFLPTKTLQRTLYAFIGLMSLYLLYSILTLTLICMPLNSYWETSVNGTCWSARTLEIVGNLNAGKC